MEGILKGYLKFFFDLRAAGYEKPSAVEVDFKQANDLRRDMGDAIFKHANRDGMGHNEMLYDGVMFVAPRNFKW